MIDKIITGMSQKDRETSNINQDREVHRITMQIIISTCLISKNKDAERTGVTKKIWIADNKTTYAKTGFLTELAKMNLMGKKSVTTFIIKIVDPKVLTM